MMKKTVKPIPLVKGDTVAVVAPAGLVKRDDIEAAISLIESWGLSVARGKYLYEQYGIFAGEDSQRLEDLQSALDDPAIKAVICARGGYGVSRIIRKVDFTNFRKTPKWVVGYSDISVLHLFINCKLRIGTLHGEMPLNYHNLDASSASLSTLRDTLFGKEKGYDWQPGTVREGKSAGILAGGNLSLLSNLLGTEIRDYLKGKILFIEERGEYLYSLDRMITGLELSGVLQHIKGLIVGGLTDIRESETRHAMGARDIILEATGNYDYPVTFDFPAGHIKENNAFILGAGIELDVTGTGASMKYLK